MTIEEYRAHTNLNYSRLKLYLRSPAHFKNPPEIEDEKSVPMQQGTFLHAYALEGRDLPYVVKPAFNPESGDQADTFHGAKKWCKAWLAERKGTAVFHADEVADQVGMREALKRSPEFQSILELCQQRERPVFASYKDVPVKALLDLEGADGNGVPFIGDVKTGIDCSPPAFFRSVIRRGWALQMAHYTAVLAQEKGYEERPSFLWVTVESKSPYNVTVYTPQKEHWEFGQRQLDYVIETHKRCTEEDDWSGYGNGILELPWQAWAERDFELTTQTETE